MNFSTVLFLFFILIVISSIFVDKAIAVMTLPGWILVAAMHMHLTYTSKGGE